MVETDVADWTIPVRVLTTAEAEEVADYADWSRGVVVEVESTPVAVEGDYTSYEVAWINDISNGVEYGFQITWFIDVQNDFLYMFYVDADGNARLGIYKLSDFALISLSPAGENHWFGGLPNAGGGGTALGFVNLGAQMNGPSRTLMSYIAGLTDWQYIISVYRKGENIWEHDVRIEDPTLHIIEGLEISVDGQYILVSTYHLDNTAKIICYRGI